MRHRLLLAPSIALLMAVSACAAPMGTVKAPSEGVITKASYATGVLAGVVRGPVGVVAAGGANVVSAGGANAVAAGGKNLKSGDRRILKVDEAPVQIAEVFVADAAGKPIPGLRSVRTDAKGRFALPGVPVGYTYVVVARVKTALGDAATLKTLAKVTALGTTADLDTASTMVTTVAVQGRQDALGEFNAATFQRAIDATARHLTNDQVPDLADTGAILARMDTLSTQVSELKSAVGALQSQLAEVREELADLKAKIEQNATPQPTPSVAITVTTPSAAVATPTPTPSASQAANTGESAYTVTTLAGSGARSFGDGQGTAASFSGMRGLAVDASGRVFVADMGNNRVRLVGTDGLVSTYAGSGLQGHVNGTAADAKFGQPSDVVLDAAGNLYVSEGGNRRVRKVAPDGTVTTFAGGGQTATVDGLGAAAQFMAPRGLAYGQGIIYMADPNGGAIRKIDATGNVTTLAGALTGPTDVAVDASGNVFVALAEVHTIVRVAPDGTLTVVAGEAGSPGAVDGTGAAARFNKPTGLAVDAQGNLFVADTDNHRIRKITPDGTVSTVAGSTDGFRDGNGAQALLSGPFDVEVDASGRLVVCENKGNRVRILALR